MDSSTLGKVEGALALLQDMVSTEPLATARSRELRKVKLDLARAIALLKTATKETDGMASMSQP